jgi:hypothetical protein
VIRYFFEDEGIKKFHAQWFTHSSKTLLQEAGHSHALYLMLSECSDVEIDAISQKCNVRELPMDSFQPDESTLDDDNDFHSGYAASFSSAACDTDRGSADLCSIASSPVSFGFQTWKLKHFSASATTISSASLAVTRNAHRILLIHEPFEMASLIMMSTIIRVILRIFQRAIIVSIKLVRLRASKSKRAGALKSSLDSLGATMTLSGRLAVALISQKEPLLTT